MKKIEYLFLAGLPKAGTTSLADWIISVMDLPKQLKEPGYLYNCDATASCYRGRKTSKRHVKFGDLPDDSNYVFDASPHYLHKDHFSNFAENIRNLKLQNHKIKVLIILKDPIERAISHFDHHKRDNVEPLEIEQVLTPGNFSLRRKDLPSLWTGYDYLGDSKFSLSLLRLENMLDEDELFISHSSILFKKVEEKNRLIRFLGVKNRKYPSFKKLNSSGIPKSKFSKLFLNIIHFSSLIAARLVSSKKTTDMLKRIKQSALNILPLKKVTGSRLSDSLYLRLQKEYQEEYRIIRKLHSEYDA